MLNDIINHHLEGNKVSSYREYGIVYGSNIDYVKLGSIELKVYLPYDVNFNEPYPFTNQYYYVPKKHYFELTTNYVRIDKIDGVHNTERIIIPNESPKLVSDVELWFIQSFLYLVHQIQMKNQYFFS